MKNIVVMDVETGGLDEEKNGLCSIALKKLNDDASLTIYIKPQEKLVYAKEAFSVNGLSIESLQEKGVEEIEAIRLIESFLEKNFTSKPIVLGQNVTFDINFMKQLFKRNYKNYNNAFHYSFLDTKVIAMFLETSGIFDFKKFNLGYLFTFLTGIEPSNAHDAMYDVLMTEDVYKLMSEKVRLMGDCNE